MSDALINAASAAELKARPKRLLMALAKVSDANHESCYPIHSNRPKVTDLCRVVGKSHATIARAAFELEDLWIDGLRVLTRTARAGHSHVWTLFPNGLPPSLSTAPTHRRNSERPALAATARAICPPDWVPYLEFSAFVAHASRNGINCSLTWQDRVITQLLPWRSSPEDVAQRLRTATMDGWLMIRPPTVSRPAGGRSRGESARSTSTGTSAAPASAPRYFPSTKSNDAQATETQAETSLRLALMGRLCEAQWLGECVLKIKAGVANLTVPRTRLSQADGLRELLTLALRTLGASLRYLRIQTELWG